jgi:hypothetical protein
MLSASVFSEVVGQVAEERLVAVVVVEVSGVIVNGIDDDETRGDDLGCGDDSARRVGEERAA